MSFWSPFSASVTAGTSNTNTNQNTYGTHTPIVSDQYTAGYKNLLANTGANGANAPQQQAMTYMQSQLDPTKSGVDNIIGQIPQLQQLGSYYSGIGGQAQSLFNQSAPQAQSYTADAFNMNPAQIAPAQSAGGYTGADYANQYAGLYGSQVTDPALAAYDYGTARNLSALDARTAAAGGFANSRSSEIPYSDMLAQAALGRGQLSSQLNQQGLTNALGFASQDANRLTQNNQFNTGAANQFALQQGAFNQQANQFNAQNQTQNSQFNAGQNQNNSQFNVNAQLQNNQQRLAALQTDMQSLQARSGLSNQIVQNIVTANGINVQAAQNLFAAGQITQSQLNDILAAAQAYNGYSYDQTQNTTQNKTSIEGKVGVG